MKKIVITPLVSRDMVKAKRCVYSAQTLMPTKNFIFNVYPIINSLDNEFVEEFSEWCDSQKIYYKITPSNGTPSKGKNECLKFLRQSGFDGLCMVDGDDMFYPSASLQIERHLMHHPGTDLLIVKPSDQIINFDRGVQIKDNIHAICWGDNIFSLKYNYGPAKNECFTDRYATGNLGGHVFYSRKLADKVSYDEEQLLGEDLLLEFECLKLHQKGELCFWLSFASDVQFLDRSDENNIQNINNSTKGDECYKRLIEKISTFIDINRSSFNELPCEFPEMIFSYQEKIDWIKKVVEKF
jgi:hypothetical protein